MSARSKRKFNREWANQNEAIADLAEFPNMTGVEAISMLFNISVSTLQASAKSLDAGIVARDEARLLQLQASIAARKQVVATDKVAQEAAAKAAAVDARLNVKVG